MRELLFFQLTHFSFIRGVLTRHEQTFRRNRIKAIVISTINLYLTTKRTIWKLASFLTFPYALPYRSPLPVAEYSSIPRRRRVQYRTDSIVTAVTIVSMLHTKNCRTVAYSFRRSKEYETVRLFSSAWATAFSFYQHKLYSENSQPTV
jgi:hypothetical protein